MAYVYQEQRPYVFTEEGQEKLFATMRRARFCLEKSGAVRADRILSDGDSWEALACIDRLVELKMLRPVTGPNTFGQDRIFVAGEVSI
jgi:hypothetical protein